jgi:hypothetical protein
MRRSMHDAAKLADELRMEQDHSAAIEAERKITETQLKDLQVNRRFLLALQLLKV